jgi:hypothetical protein
LIRNFVKQWNPPAQALAGRSDGARIAPSRDTLTCVLHKPTLLSTCPVTGLYVSRNIEIETPIRFVFIRTPGAYVNPCTAGCYAGLGLGAEAMQLLEKEMETGWGRVYLRRDLGTVRKAEKVREFRGRSKLSPPLSGVAVAAFPDRFFDSAGSIHGFKWPQQL